MDDNGEVLLGGVAIAAEIGPPDGQTGVPHQAYRWAKNGTIKAKKAGQFLATTKKALRESFQPDAT